MAAWPSTPARRHRVNIAGVYTSGRITPNTHVSVGCRTHGAEIPLKRLGIHLTQIRAGGETPAPPLRVCTQPG